MMKQWIKNNYATASLIYFQKLGGGGGGSHNFRAQFNEVIPHMNTKS